jgi:DNA-binding transcriptional MerR regulator
LAARKSTSKPRPKPATRAKRPVVTQEVLPGTFAGEEEAGFRGPQVCAIVGISYRQLDYWARTELVRPSLADAQGSGTQRSYSYRDLVRLKVIKSLLDSGVKLQVARKAIEYLREDVGEDWGTVSLVLNGTNSVLARTGDDLVDLVRHGQGVLNIVPLGSVVEELDASIHDLGPEAAAAPAGPARPTRGRAPKASGGG